MTKLAVFTLIAVIAAAAPPSRRATRLNVLEAFQYE
jgi:ABC-type lipoprotein release transport system permease subunit